MGRIKIYTENISGKVDAKKNLENAFMRLIKIEDKTLVHLNFIICTDEALLEINKSYLNHDYYTDIITFDNSSNDNDIEGDIYISYERVKENASIYKKTIRNELTRVMIHGILHLCGYKDKTPKERNKMTQKEDEFLAFFKNI